MPRVIAAALALLMLLPAAGSAGVSDADHADLFNGGEIHWRHPRAGIPEAAKSGKPVVMVFHATWCAACKRYRAVFKNPAVVAASKDFVMILVDAEKDKQLNGAFSPDGTYVPRTLFVDSEGDVSKALVGKDPQYPHTIDVDNPDELLALMLKARATGFGRGAPASGPDSRI